MELMKGERVLMEGANRALILTTRRMRFEGKQWGRRQITSIMLDELSACEITYKTHPSLLVIAALIALVTLVQLTKTPIPVPMLAGGLVASAIFLAIYSLSREQVLSLSSASASIKVDTSDLSFEQAMQFIDAAEHAKASIVLRALVRSHTAAPQHEATE